MERLLGIFISVLFGFINKLSIWGGANRDDLRLTARLPIIAALAILMLLGVLPATHPQSTADAAAAAYLADDISSTAGIDRSTRHESDRRLQCATSSSFWRSH